jgi:excinuclease ABC subunit A
LVHRKHTTSFANERIDPGLHDVIDGSPGRVLLVDQSRKDIRSPARYLGLDQPLLKIYAASGECQALGLDERQLRRPCATCKGRGLFRMEMGFLPDSLTLCETCKGTGYSPEAWQVRINGISLPEVNQLTLDEVYENFSEQEKIVRSLLLAKEVGLGYLTWKQPGYSMSGGEAQRLKIVRQLGKKTITSSLFILDEPTVGQHMEDTRRLVHVLRRLVVEGHSVILIEHHVHVLAACDWLIELGPGGGVQGGRVIASGTPEQVASLDTPTAPYLREVLEAGR